MDLNKLPSFFVKKIRKEHFQNLVAVAFSDGNIDETELEFLAERALDFGLEDTEVKEIMDRADQLKFEVPLNSVEREEQLSDVVFMSMVDGVVRDSEYELCLIIAEKLEFQKKDLDQVIELTRELWNKSK